METTLAKDARPKPFVFVIMPFKKEFDDVYKVGIQEVCEKCGLHCGRADEQIYEGTILDRLYNQIAKADIIVADMTGQNPNVFYETGYAHALGKRVILLTQRKEDIPFDLVHYPHIIYNSRMVDLRPELEKRLRWMAENPEDSLQRVDMQLEIFMWNINLEEFSEVPLHFDENITYPIEKFLVFKLHNTARKAINSDEFQIGVELPVGIDVARNGDGTSMRIPGRGCSYTPRAIPRMFPDSWHEFQFSIAAKPLPPGERLPFRVRVFTELGSREYPFEVVGYSRAEFNQLQEDFKAGKLKPKSRGSFNTESDSVG